MNVTAGTGKIIGIDLGTTYCAIACLGDDGRPTTVLNANRQPITPSAVYFDPSGEVIVGREALQAGQTDPSRLAQFAKRDMGERFYHKPVDGRQLSPHAISALILKKLKQDAQQILGPIAGAVITVPAYFNETRRQATLAAGEIAGLRVLDIINEPTAAALAYAYQGLVGESVVDADDLIPSLRLEEDDDAADVLAVYDLGGGTFDVTILRVEGRKLTVLATDGDVYLGGADWDQRIFNHAAESFRKAHGSDPRDDDVSKQLLLSSAEEAKCQLSTRASVRFRVTHDGKTHTVELSREQFESLTADLLYRTENRLNRVLQTAGLLWGQVGQVLTVGGSTRMPQVAAMLRRLTRREPNTSLAPDEVVAHGAAIHAAMFVVQKPSQRANAAAAKLADEVPATTTAPPSRLAPTQTPQTSNASDDSGVLTIDLIDDDNNDAPSTASDFAGEEALTLLDDDDSPSTDAGVKSNLEFVEINDDNPRDAADSEELILLDDQDVQSYDSSQAADAASKAAASAAQARANQSPDNATDKSAAKAKAKANMEDTDVLDVEVESRARSILSSMRTANVTAHSLGVALKKSGGIRANSVLIPRNTALPASVTRRYGTVVPNQSAVTIQIIEGESELAEDCLPLGSCRVAPLPWGLRQGSTIYVTFSYDGSGLLEVKAVEATTGKSAGAAIQRESGLNPGAVNRARGAVERTTVV